MTLDIRGGRKNTAVNHSDYVVFEEMLSNSIDSYLVRKSRADSIPPFLVVISVEASKADLFGSKIDVEICFSDNGAGFGDEEVKAFVTKDSTYKDQLRIPGIGKCKGAGRIQFFHHFDRLSIDSVFEKSGQCFRRKLIVNETTREISEDSFIISSEGKVELQTKFKLSGRRNNILLNDQRVELDQVSVIFSASSICSHLYMAMLQRLIILKGLIGSFKVEVRSNLNGQLSTSIIEEGNLPEPVGQVVKVPLVCAHSKESQIGPHLNVTRYSFAENDFPNFQHEVALCANSAIVLPITRRYLRHLVDRRKATAGKFELLLVESDLLEEKVNQQRDGFDIPTLCTDSYNLTGEYSLDDIVESLEDYVFEIITPGDFDKNALVASAEKKFGITRQMIEGASVKIRYGDSEESIARRVLRKLQEDIVGDTSSLSKLRDELLSLDPRTADFRRKVNELSWKYTSSIKKMDMTSLSQLVVRRSAMIEVLNLAVGKLLSCQTEQPGKKNENERIIHNIFFPMGKDSIETTEHDIWLLNEEYQYFNYIASDKPLKSIKRLEGESLFEQDVDESLEKLFALNNKNHDGKRPDIAIFTKEGAAIIIEFKAPDVEIQEHIPDLAQYARLLAAKSNGRIRKFYGYLIGCKLDPSRMILGYTKFSNGRGYFNSNKLVDDDTGRVYGELYSEVLLYEDFIERAALRLRVYKEKLKFNFD